MNPIKQLSGTITNVRDLSPTAREYKIKPFEPLTFTAGAFVNLFIEYKGKTLRRAFSISSSDHDNQSLSLSIRLSPQGELTPILWSEDFTNKEVRIMGPLGLNTAEKITSNRVFLFGFGVGAGVVKSLADHLIARDELKSLTIMTGNRNTKEILHKDFFDDLANKNKNVSVTYVVSDINQSDYPTGYIQNNLNDYNFNDSDIYMCGQGTACEALKIAIKKTEPKNCHFFIEDFH